MRAESRIASRLAKATKKACRLARIEVTYQGTGNYSQLIYDGLGRNVQIVETQNGSVTSTEQFVWTVDGIRPFEPCEARSAGGSVTAQYFSLGEVMNGTTMLSSHSDTRKSKITCCSCYLPA
jgi:hypothetical protein